ncbi:MAG: hypothetical protein AAB443_02510 [Patescibacteria group bacterium]
MSYKKSNFASRRFAKIFVFWGILAFLSTFFNLERGGPNFPDILLGIVGLYGPFIFWTVLDLRFRKSTPKVAGIFWTFESTCRLFLFETYMGLKWYWTAQIWLGRMCMVLGFILSISGFLGF